MEYRICQVYNSLDSEFNLDRLKPVQTGTPTYRPTGVPVRLNTLFQKIQYCIRIHESIQCRHSGQIEVFFHVYKSGYEIIGLTLCVCFQWVNPLAGHEPTVQY